MRKLFAVPGNIGSSAAKQERFDPELQGLAKKLPVKYYVGKIKVLQI